MASPSPCTATVSSRRANASSSETRSCGSRVCSVNAPTVKICPTCGTEYPSDERFCPRDGSALRALDGGSELVGSIIADRYHVVKKLGEGGMGRVYLAEHGKMARMSAVKGMNRRM